MFDSILMDPRRAFAALSLALLIAYVAFMLWRSLRIRRRATPGHCYDCGRRLDAEEIRYYGGHCERCELTAWAEF